MALQLQSLGNDVDQSAQQFRANQTIWEGGDQRSIIYRLFSISSLETIIKFPKQEDIS